MVSTFKVGRHTRDAAHIDVGNLWQLCGTEQVRWQNNTAARAQLIVEHSLIQHGHHALLGYNLWICGNLDDLITHTLHWHGLHFVCTEHADHLLIVQDHHGLTLHIQLLINVRHKTCLTRRNTLQTFLQVHDLLIQTIILPVETILRISSLRQFTYLSHDNWFNLVIFGCHWSDNLITLWHFKPDWLQLWLTHIAHHLINLLLDFDNQAVVTMVLVHKCSLKLIAKQLIVGGQKLVVVWLLLLGAAVVAADAGAPTNEWHDLSTVLII